MLHLILLHFAVLHLLFVSCTKHDNDRTPKPKSESKNQDAAFKKENNVRNLPDLETKHVQMDTRNVIDDKKAEVKNDDNRSSNKEKKPMRQTKPEESENKSNNEIDNTKGKKEENTKAYINPIDKVIEEWYANMTPSQRLEEQKQHESYCRFVDNENASFDRRLEERRKKNVMINGDKVENTQPSSKKDKDQSSNKETSNNGKSKKSEMSRKNGSKKSKKD